MSLHRSHCPCCGRPFNHRTSSYGLVMTCKSCGAKFPLRPKRRSSMTAVLGASVLGVLVLCCGLPALLIGSANRQKQPTQVTEASSNRPSQVTDHAQSREPRQTERKEKWAVGREAEGQGSHSSAAVTVVPERLPPPRRVTRTVVNVIRPERPGLEIVVGMSPKYFLEYQDGDATVRKGLLQSGGVWLAKHQFNAKHEMNYKGLAYIRPLEGPFEGRLVAVDERAVGEKQELVMTTAVGVDPADHVDFESPSSRTPATTGTANTAPPRSTPVGGSAPSGKSVYVHGHYRSDGTYVRPYYRSKPSR